MDNLALKPAPEPVKPDNGAGEVTYQCPFCDDHSGHMHVNVRKGIYHCYKCGKGGTTLSMRRATGINWPIDEMSRLYSSSTGATIRELLGAMFRTTNPFTAANGAYRTTDSIDYVRSSINENARPFTIPQGVAIDAGLTSLYMSGVNTTFQALRVPQPLAFLDPDGKPFYNICGNVPYKAATYLERRRVEPKEVYEWGLHVAIDTELTNTVGRIIVPSWCPVTGYMRSFMARTPEKGVNPRYTSPKTKSLWPQTILSPLARDMAGLGVLNYCVLVEGPFDAIAVARTGLPVAALCGKHLSMEALAEFKDWGLTSAIIMLDTGETAAELTLASLLHSNGIGVKMARMKGNKDPGDSKRDEILATLQAASQPEMLDVLSTIFKMR
jgi:hypothetical protein